MSFVLLVVVALLGALWMAMSEKLHITQHITLMSFYESIGAIN
jgi:hypothetical protein